MDAKDMDSKIWAVIQKTCGRNEVQPSCVSKLDRAIFKAGRKEAIKMKNPFSNRDESEFKVFENPIVRCEKGHLFGEEQAVRFVKRREDKEIWATKNMCPICYVNFFNENISGIDET